AEQERSRHMTTALRYAHAIQNQKDWEKQILSTIEILLDFPSVDPSSFAEQANYLAVSLSPFRAADFEDLIEERRIDSRCGWPLCCNPPKSTSNTTKSPWKASKRDREFCSLECAKKSIFVKAQLSKVAPWERGVGQHVFVALPEDDQKLIESLSPLHPGGVEGSGQRQIATATDLAELALERGEQPTSLRPQQVMTDQVVEKTPTFREPVFISSGSREEAVAGRVEGYTPK
ncbi:hypothetical protein K431DRAFT_193816, partial [Polychaeton citri CBS 116435]